MPIKDWSKYRFSGIYFIKNKVTGKFYVGSSLNIRNRLYHHVYLLRINKCHSPKLQNSYNKYGYDCFEFGVIEKCEDFHLRDREAYWILYYNSVQNGYNCSIDTNCSTRGLKHSKESKLKMSIAQKALASTAERKKMSSDILIKYNKSKKGIPKTKEHKDKISKSNIGKKLSAETIQKMRECKLNNPVRYWLGKTFSIETKNKIRLSKVGKKGAFSTSYKPIIQLNKSGEIIGEFYGAADAARNLNIGRTSIKNCLNNYCNSAGGFIFKFK